MKQACPLTQSNRRLSQILLKFTLLLAVSLGIVSGILQVWTDLRQEKDAVQHSANEFLKSVAPSAASAAYNFHDDAAERVADGLFTQRAITDVTIINEGAQMVARSRNVMRTLPTLGAATRADPVSITEPLLSPADATGNTVIGSISITVDRSVVPPAIVNRMLNYFVLAALKNTLLGLLLVALVYGVLARHIINLVEATGRWSPEDGALKLARPPRMLANTELQLLGERIQELTASAAGKIRQAETSRRKAEKSNSALTQKSENLSKAIEVQNRELQRKNAKLKHMAERDALTGLCNRRSFDRYAQEVLAHAADQDLELSVVLLDVDHFKAYNDFYGHQAGDECLQKVASALKSCASLHNAFAARFGGEEFVLLIASADNAAKIALVKAIHQHIQSAAIAHERSEVANVITVSVGCASNAEVPITEKWSLDRLLTAADEALYEAKRKGRNRSQFSTIEMQNRVKQARAARRQLLDAVQNAEFEPFFQPQFDGQTGSVTGVEVLARWVRSDGSIIEPEAFIATASDSGFITTIDAIILDKVTALIKTAVREGIELPRLSINLQKESLLAPNYVRSVVALAEDHRVPLAVELLETALLDETSDEIAFQLDLLRDAHIELEIDDFGTGHTSLISLMAIKPSRLKIAKELVVPMLDSTDHHKLTMSVIDLGRTLGIEVLAEGVETAALAEMLIRNGCVLHQGYYYAKPMAGREFLTFIDENAQRAKAHVA
ncbi:MAG: bifunctional diguanylate cyclase/phosphodiesterase [Pseudomonadota bacterium]